MPSRASAGRPRPIRAVPSAAIWAGLRSTRCKSERRTTSTRIPGTTGSPDQADTAEIVVQRRPGAHLVACALQPCLHLRLEAGLQVDEARYRVEARPRDCGLRVEPLVEDPGDDLQERPAEPRSARSAGREDDALVVEGDAGSHHAAHPL